MAGKRLDDLDRRLIAEIAKDPRRPYVALGKELGVSGTTAAARLERLRAADLLRITVLPGLARLGLTTEVLGSVEVEAGALDAAGERLRGSPYVLRVMQVSGERNIAFEGIFPSDTALGEFLRDLESIDGVRRVVISYVLEHLKRDEGWEAVFASPPPSAAPRFDVAVGAAVPKHLEAVTNLAASWITAFVAGDTQRLRQLSDPEVVYIVVRPRAAAGTWTGLAAVLELAQSTSQVLRSFLYRIVAAAEAAPPYDVLIDALSPTEDASGRLLTTFSRLGYAVKQGRISRVVSIGQMNLEEVPADVPEAAGEPR